MTLPRACYCLRCPRHRTHLPSLVAGAPAPVLCFDPPLKAHQRPPSRFRLRRTCPPSIVRVHWAGEVTEGGMGCGKQSDSVASSFIPDELTGGRGGGGFPVSPCKFQIVAPGPRGVTAARTRAAQTQDRRVAEPSRLQYPGGIRELRRRRPRCGGGEAGGLPRAPASRDRPGATPPKLVEAVARLTVRPRQ